MARIPGLRRVFTRPRSPGETARDVDDELAFHLDMLAAELAASGVPPEEARAAARRRFGDVDRYRDRCTEISNRREDEMRRTELLATIRQDLAFATRTLRKAPTFTLVALLTLALGIGASTAIYSVVQAVLLRPLPFQEPERLVRIWLSNPGQQIERSDISRPDFEIWRDESQAFSSLAAYYQSGSGLALTGMGEPQRLPTAYVTADFFRTLGVSAARGRVLLPEEDSIGRNRVVLLAHATWMRLFGGDPTAVGKTLTLDGEPFTIVGVARPEFRFPAEDVAFWVPRSVIPESGIPSHRWNRVYAVIGRLAPGATTAQAQAEIRTFAQRIAEEFPDANAGYTTVLTRPIREVIVGDVRPALLVLLGAVGLVLLVSCVNVANLLLARGTTRGRELAIRTALGAGRGRIVRQLLTESLVLAVVGGALGVALAAWGASALVALSAEYLPRAADVRLDAGVLLFALALSVATGVAFGLVPALRTTSSDPQANLREGSRGSTEGRGGQRLRLGLVAAEVALAVLLVVGAGLALRSFARLTNVHPGFDAERTLVARFNLPSEQFDTREARLAAYDRMLDRIRALPGVTAAGMTKNVPMRGTGEPATFTIPGRPVPRQGEEPLAMAHPVSPDYFRAMGIPLLEGEDMRAAAADTSGLIVIVNESLARQHWPGESAVGKPIKIGEEEWRVVGVVGDVRGAALDEPPEPALYVSRAVMNRSVAAIAVRTTGDPAALARSVVGAIREVVPDQPITEITPMSEVVADTVAAPRVLAVLLALFGLLALVLAVIGLYGVVAYVVSQRTQEIGIRMALGAEPRSVVGMMLRRGLAPVVVGLVAGLALAVAGTRLLGGLLYEVSPTDPPTYALVSLVLLAAAALAAWLPSRRAARIAPSVALRGD